MNDYKQIKKGIKQAEMDKFNYKAVMACWVCLGIVVGLCTQNAIIGFITAVLFSVPTVKKYYEI